ncbi:MAG: T9SS type A sorting domain-containing protein, partial [Bacteroidota bacterium]
QDSYTLSPNPTNQWLKFQRQEGFSEYQQQYQIIDFLGRTVLSGTIQTSQLSIDLDLSTISSGTYRLLIQNPDGSMEALPFIKE